jgi:hypothetical protein
VVNATPQIKMSWETVYWVSQLLLVVFAGVALISGAVVNKRQSKQLLTLETNLDEQRQKTEEQREKTAKAELSLLELQKLLSEPRAIDLDRANEILGSGAKGFVELTIAANSHEVNELSVEVRKALTSRGWVITSEILSIYGDEPGSKPGIRVEGGDETWWEAAKAEGRSEIENMPEPQRTLFLFFTKAVKSNPAGVVVANNGALAKDTFKVWIGPKY